MSEIVKKADLFFRGPYLVIVGRDSDRCIVRLDEIAGLSDMNDLEGYSKILLKSGETFVVSADWHQMMTLITKEKSADWHQMMTLLTKEKL